MIYIEIFGMILYAEIYEKTPRNFFGEFLV